MGADVWVIDKNVDVLRQLWAQFDRPLNTVYSTRTPSSATAQKPTLSSAGC
jgi:alanine dehydrogenase